MLLVVEEDGQHKKEYHANDAEEEVLGGRNSNRIKRRCVYGLVQLRSR